VYLGSAGLGTPKITSSLLPSQARPSADPTLPAPIMAILISISIEGGVELSIADCRVGGHPVVHPADVTSVRRGSQPRQPVRRQRRLYREPASHRQDRSPPTANRLIKIAS